MNGESKIKKPEISVSKYSLSEIFKILFNELSKKKI